MKRERGYYMEEFDLKGAIDLHFHAGPDIRERKLTYLEAAMQAKEAGMRAILIKSHSTITADIASLIQPRKGYSGLRRNCAELSIGRAQSFGP
jgi:hypothetical protein